MLDIVLLVVSGQFLILLAYKTCIWYIKSQRSKCKGKFVDDEYFNKVQNNLYSLCGAVLLFLAYTLLFFLNKSKQDVLVLLIVSFVFILIAFYIYKLRIPYIERAMENGNPKYADEGYVYKLKRWLKIVGSICAFIALVLIFLMRFGIL